MASSLAAGSFHSTSAEEYTVTAGVIVIGNEILSGRTREANVEFLARRLNELGVRLLEARIVRDEMAAIVGALRALSPMFDYLFTTGGIGPTHDDITADAVAEAFALPIDVDAVARARLEAFYPKGSLNEARLRMARIPQGASLIDNPISVAPGFRLGNVFVLAGVPAIMQAMFESIRHEIAGGPRLLSLSLAVPLPEGDIAQPLRLAQSRFPDVEMGSYPTYRAGQFETAIVLRSTDAALLDRAGGAVRQILRGLGAEPRERRGF
jgi:molybdenum cofactor synthesis domain-containing protein